MMNETNTGRNIHGLRVKNFFRGGEVLQQRKIIHVREELQVARVIRKQDKSILTILKTLVFRDVFDMLLGVMMILCFMISLVFAFGV